jgi:hypothetical protein
MNEPFQQLVATLHKVQVTMGPQLVRLGATRQLDKVRLPRLQKEAAQFKGAATALLGRLMQNEVALDLILQTKALVTFFDHAEQQATALLRRHGQAAPEAAIDPDDEDADDVTVDQEHKEPALVGSGRLRSGPSSKDRSARAAARMAKLGLAGGPPARTSAPLRRRSSM